MNRLIATLLAAAAASSCPVTSRAADADLAAWLDAGVADGRIAAASVAHVDRAEVQFRHRGRRTSDDATPPDARTQYQIGSITKVFTHLLLAEMREIGAVDLTTRIDALIPAPFVPRNPDVAGIPLGALATHTSGLPRLPPNLDPGNPADPYAGYDAATLYAGLAMAREGQPLGTSYAYSNFGVGALGHLLGRADRSTYADAVTKHVIVPLRLQQTGFAPGDNAAVPVVGGAPVSAWRFDDALAGAGALWGSVEDLARLIQAQLGTHEHALRHALADDTEVVVESAGTFAVTRVWHVAGSAAQPIYWHNGGTAGFHSFVGWRPDQGRGVAILVSGDADPTAIGLQVLGHVATAAVAPKIDRSILGQYRLSPQFGIGVHVLEGALVAQATAQPPLALHRVDDAHYAIGDVDASIRFVREQGRIVALELLQGGRVQRGERVADVAEADVGAAKAPMARREIAIDAAQLDDYLGRFVLAPGAEFTVRRGDAGLEVQLSGQPFFPVFASAADRFFYRVVDAELQFERDAAGKVIALVLHQGGIEQRATRR